MRNLQREILEDFCEYQILPGEKRNRYAKPQLRIAISKKQPKATLKVKYRRRIWTVTSKPRLWLVPPAPPKDNSESERREIHRQLWAEIHRR